MFGQNGLHVEIALYKYYIWNDNDASNIGRIKRRSDNIT